MQTESAIALDDFNDDAMLFRTRDRAKGLARKAVVGAVMRKLAHLIYGVANSSQPFDPSLAAARLVYQNGI